MGSQLPEGLGWYARHQRRIDWGLLAVVLALFSYSVLNALALLPGEQGFQPQRMVTLSAAMLIQSAASLLQRRFPWASIGLLVLSLLVLVSTFVIDG
jgi:hypothetical protein